ncbi:MAG: hypothetical protein KAH20_02445 [Methylococcales bacterium]|nr:hypothetical protein [Methylococcales bacterium]
MQNNKVKVLSLIIGCALSSQASAEVLKIDSMNITSGNLVRSFNPNDKKTPIELDFSQNTDLVGGFVNKDTSTDGQSISQTNFRMVKDESEPTQYTYTAASNIRHNSEWTGDAPVEDGTLKDSSYVIPTGTVDDEAGTITLDLSSWFANHMSMNQNLGGVATGKWDPKTGEFSDLSWTATLTQGKQKGAKTTWTLQGKVLATSPAPSKNPAYTSNDGVLKIPAVDVIDDSGNSTTYKATMKLVPSSSGKLLFEVTEASPK